FNLTVIFFTSIHHISPALSIFQCDILPKIACYHRKRPQRRTRRLMKQVPSETDFIVVGAGVAGLRAAIALAEAGPVLVLAKQELTESATQYAQGGVAVA